jgi:RNA polymerase sigma-70 factor (ECF subfamily)
VSPGAPADRRLLDRVRAGDEDALAEIYDAHAPLVYGTALHLTADRDDAATVTEAVFVELWTGADRYAGATVPLGSLLAALARSCAGPRRPAPWGAAPVLALTLTGGPLWS